MIKNLISARFALLSSKVPSIKAPLTVSGWQGLKKRQLLTAASILLGSVWLTGCDSQSATFSMVDSKADEAVESTAAATQQDHLADTANHDADERLPSLGASPAPETRGQSLLAAAKTDDNPAQNLATMDNRSENSLHATLIGDYEGMLPCSFCEGINVTLNLFSDGSVIKTSVFEAPDVPKAPLSESGVYRQDNNKIIIAYEDQSIESFEIQDNHLVMFGKDKKPNPDFTLSRK